jgi:hypothetical protein
MSRGLWVRLLTATCIVDHGTSGRTAGKRSINPLRIGGTMSIRRFGAVLAAVCAAALIIPVAAGAQTLPSGTNTASLTHIPVSGVAKNHKTFTGRFHC